MLRSIATAVLAFALATTASAFQASNFVSSAVTAAALQLEGLSDTQIKNVKARLIESAQKSWELGTAAQALLELDARDLSVFGDSPLPPTALAAGSPVLTIASDLVKDKPTWSKMLIEDGAAGDPPSSGVAVLLANATWPNDRRYADAAGQQLDFLLNDVPRSDAGAISHRTEQVQLWADFIYMVPPFLAYFGAVEQGPGQAALLREAYNQIKLYRDALRDPDDGVWRHVVYGSWEDRGKWATGQGWAAMGTLRVHQTLAHSSLAKDFKSEQADLVNWAAEILNGTWTHQRSDGGLYNYLDRGDDSFLDMASTALVSAATFRLASITGKTTNLDKATKAFKLVKKKLDDDGWLKDPVNPWNFSEPGAKSPEGQAFVVMLHSAWRDWAEAQRAQQEQLGAAAVAAAVPSDVVVPSEIVDIAKRVPRGHHKRRGHH